MYCGNVVPANLLKADCKLLTQISTILAKTLKLKGINGFDFVLKNHYPYLMEINPRIPGSIRASESSFELNLLKMHIESFDLDKWNNIKNELRTVRTMKHEFYTTKLIMFSPKEIDKKLVVEINKLEFIHDKSAPDRNILKDEPICTVLYKAKSFSESYFGALKVIDKIKQIINQNVSSF
jgi:predicted ATP-grasp superfamily ATP-dependent carboligase